MRWLFLLFAGISEVGWVYSLKSTDGFTRLLPLIPYAACGFATAFFLSQSLKTIPVGVTYSVWTGIAVIGSNVVELAIEHQPVQLARLFFIALILLGIIGLQLSFPRH